MGCAPVLPIPVEALAHEGKVAQDSLNKAKLDGKNPKGVEVEEIVLDSHSRLPNFGRQKKVAGRHSESGVGNTPHCRISMIRGRREANPENSENPQDRQVMVPPSQLVVPTYGQFEAVPPWTIVADAQPRRIAGDPTGIPARL